MDSNSENNISSKESVRAFFNAFGKADLEAILELFDPQVEITAICNKKPTQESPYGKFLGTEGLKTFLQNMEIWFDTKSFAVENVIGEGDTAFANGSFQHELKSTGRMFVSDWALMCKTNEGKISEYHFYEDSHKFYEANRII